MAFYYYTSDKIQEIDPEAIPDSFIDYYQDLSDDMRLEIAKYHPDLYAKIEKKSKDPEETDFDLFDDSNLSLEEQRIIDKWESISIRAWHQDAVTVEVLVCKILPDSIHRCKIHKRDLIKKQIRYVDMRGSVYGHYGYLCPDCMDLYVEESKIGGIIDNLDKRGIKMWIQPLEDTLQEWEEYVDPIEITDETVIYIPEKWADVDMVCPSDGGKLTEDAYKKVYKDREVRFDACQCEKCKKLMMRNSLAQQLDLNCGKIGVPEIEFSKIKPEVKKNIVYRAAYKPDYFIQNGIKTEYDYDERGWEELPESVIFVVSYSRVCTFEDHDTDDALVLVNVQEKKGGSKKYLVLVGYCKDCGKYYIAQEDYAIIYGAGRPAVTVYDDTNSNYYIQSGSVFDDEKMHLNELECKFDARINEIKADSRYVSQYAVTSGYYDDGGLTYKKEKSRELQEEIDEITEFIPKPYGYRVDLTFASETKNYYLGAVDIEIDGERVFSFNSPEGRGMVNYRTIELMVDGAKHSVKRRRQFDIDNATLFGYMEQSDEDAIFREGLTDPYLVKVLNIRKQQHQLVDIMFTIQENQNSIVDMPLSEEIIVQGCAGSGKTVVLLQRLSALKYGNESFDFDRVMILTPNDNFNVHIKGLASSLQLRYVDRFSVEDYYISLLLKYDASFKLKYAISDEMNVNQTYVDYMYSDEFLEVFQETFDSTLYSLKKLYEEVLSYIPIVLKETEQNPDWDNYIIDMIDKIAVYNTVFERHIYKSSDKKTLEGGNEKYDVLLSDDLTNEDREIIRVFLKKIDGYTVKSIYNAVYESASNKADDILYRRTGKHYLGSARGTHRYDLYLQLHFAVELYRKTVGNNNLICIDEGQDLSVNEYRLIKKINGEKLIFNIYGDTNQLLKPGRGIHDWDVLKTVIENPHHFSLNENFRNTNQITQFCNDTFKMNILQTGVDGHKVNEIIRNKLESMLAELSIEDDRVVILLPRQVKKKEYIDLERLPMALREKIGDQIGNGRICVSYVDEIKGIEFDKVYVVPNGMTTNEKYIAYTRALSELTIVFDEELEEKIREHEEEKQKAAEKVVKKALEPEDLKRDMAKKTNVKFGKVKTSKGKALEYVDSEIVYSCSCKRCGKKIELTIKEVRKLEEKNYDLPKTCKECKSALAEEITVGQCGGCGKKFVMTRSKFEHLKAQNSLPKYCVDCTQKIYVKKAEKSHKIFKTCKCIVCGKKFDITYGEKEHIEENGWKLPTRCSKCRKKKRDLFN